MTAPIDVDCPARTCGAKAGEPCRSSTTGRLREETHGLRWLATLDGPLVPCLDGSCWRCEWTGWVQQS